jgi:hypothetical protein
LNEIGHALPVIVPDYNIRIARSNAGENDTIRVPVPVVVEFRVCISPVCIKIDRLDIANFDIGGGIFQDLLVYLPAAGDLRHGGYKNEKRYQALNISHRSGLLKY